MDYFCLVVIAVDSVMKINNENHLQVCLEECKYAAKKTRRLASDMLI